MKKQTRFIIGVAAILTGLILSFAVIDTLGEVSFVFTFLGGVIFVYLNPELMRGE